MKITSNFKALVINSKSTEYDRKDGTKGIMHQISFDQDGECGTCSCTEDVVKSVARLMEYELTAEYNDQYKSLKIIGCKLIPNSNPAIVAKNPTK